jgi:putative ABC transport system permease protein
MRKNVIREILSSPGRFLAILLIVALGVGFYSGLCICQKTMISSMDRYWNKQNMYDVRLISTLGFDEDELQNIQKQSGVNVAEGGYFTDALASVSDAADGEEAVHIQSITEQVNVPELLQGRLPGAADECLADDAAFDEKDIGSTITVSSDNTKDTLDLLREKTFTITGICRSPLYMNAERGNTDIGSGRLSAYILVPQKAFDSDYYHEIYVDAVTDGQIYSTAYKKSVSMAKKALKKAALSAADTRYQKIMDDARSEAKVKIEDEMAVKKKEVLEEKLKQLKQLQTAQTAQTAGMTDSAASMSEAEIKKQIESKFAVSDEEMNRMIDDALADADLPDAPQITVLTRNENAAYAGFDSDASIVSSIAQIFPLFFFLVAALVCITTMTRMIEDDRAQIGIFKSLGYSNAAVMSKYFLYSGSAGILGGIGGYFAGIWLLPNAVWTGYATTYDLPGKPVYLFDLKLFLISLAVALLCTVFVTWIRCHEDLDCEAADLIRPKAPPIGKKILLERISPIWKKMSFLHKVTLRNLFRYKGRFLMMLIGISGCTALLVAGFGIRNIFMGLGNEQYGVYTLYDGAVSFTDPLTDRTRSSFEQDAAGMVRSIIYVSQHSGDIAASAGGSSSEITFTAMDTDTDSSQDDMNVDTQTSHFVNLEQGGQVLSLPADGEILLDLGMARSLKLKKGDQVRISGTDGECELTVSGIYENRLGNGAYISTETMEQCFEGGAADNAAFVLFPDDVQVHQAGKELLGASNVANVTLSQDNADRFTSSMEGLDYIIFVVILCAGALAFIVIYNLTNINISERMREIATVKVLGFYENEACAYVFRENTMLSVLSGAVGLLLGKCLLIFIVDRISLATLVLTPQVGIIGYAGSFVLTMLFSWLMQLFMRHRIAGIHMAESLKSVE